MKKRSLVLVGSLVLSLAFLLPAGNATHDPNGTHVTDPAGDVMSKVVSNRNLYAVDDPITSELDIIEAGMRTLQDPPIGGERFIEFNVKVNGPLPVPGADALGPQGFAPGVTAMDFYQVWALDQNQPNNSMTAAQPTILTCGPAYSQQKLSDEDLGYDGYIYRVDYDEHNDSGNINGCRYATAGPWHPSDGWAFAILLSIAIDDSGKIAYDWSWARYDAIEGIHWTRPGAAHDRVECAALNPTAFECETPDFGTGPGQVLHDTPATLNGANYNKDGTQRVGSAWPGSGFSSNQAVLRIPYLMRDDDPDDDNGKTDEMRINTLMLPGDRVTGFTALLGAAFSVNIPPGGCVAYGAIIYGITPAPHDNELVTKDECFSYSAGSTFNSDWAPGNPFTTLGGAAFGGIPGLFGPVCVATACNPNWGGQIIGDGLAPGTGSYQPGLGAPFCRYPAGLAFGGGSVPSGVTTRTVDDPLGGGTIRLVDNGGGGGPLVTQQYDGVPGATNPDGGEPGVTVSGPQGGPNPCGHVRDSHATNWILVGTGTSFTAK